MASSCYQDDINRVVNANSIYIYGAGRVAESVVHCLINEPFSKKIEAFVVSSIDEEADNNSGIYDIPIIACDNIDAGIPILIAVMEKYRDEIIDTLKNQGIDDAIVCTFESGLWGELRKTAYKYDEEQQGRNVISVRDDITSNDNVQDAITEGAVPTIYIAKSSIDRPLKQTIIDKPWEHDIQVGAALTEDRISDITDDTGDNISTTNRQYCEMTALYWVWKNTSEDYIGLSHYRRRFDLTEDEIRYAIAAGYDLVVTYPLVNYPDVGLLYSVLHSSDDWSVFREAVRYVSPDYMDAFEEFESGKYYIPYNMMIIKRELLDAYCEWAFAVYEYCVSHFKKKEDKYQRRDIGFLSERVMTLYLIKHRYEIKIAYADKVFYE